MITKRRVRIGLVGLGMSLFLISFTHIACLLDTGNALAFTPLMEKIAYALMTILGTAAAWDLFTPDAPKKPWEL